MGGRRASRNHEPRQPFTGNRSGIGLGGRPPWTAADASACWQAGQGAGRGRGGPPHIAPQNAGYLSQADTPLAPAWAFDCHLSRPEARRDLRGGSLEGYAPVTTLAAGDIVITRGGRSTLTGQPTMPTTRGFALSCCTACLIFGQAAPQKHLTARELFYAAAQAPASQTGNARPPAKRSTRTPAK